MSEAGAEELPPAAEALLGDLAACLPQVSGLHLALQGSARSRGLAAAGDLDVHAVVSELTRARYEGLVDAARACCRALDRATGDAWVPETGHGPLKPDPGRGHRRQLHLLIDDLESLRRRGPAPVLHLHAGGRRLAGRSLLALAEVDRGRDAVLASCMERVEEQRRALAEEVLPVRRWRFAPAPSLEPADLPLDTPWRRHCLLRHASAVADRLCLTACLEHPDLVLELARTPTLYETVLTGLDPASLSGAHWTRVRHAARERLDQRSRQLQRLAREPAAAART